MGLHTTNLPASDFPSTHTIRRSFLQSLISPPTLPARYDLGGRFVTTTTQVYLSIYLSVTPRPVTMTTKPVRCQFLCEKRQLEFKHDIPSSLVGPAALGNPAMPQMFTTVMRPIVMEHADASLKACEDKCSSKDCKRDATTVVATPMSVS